MRVRFSPAMLLACAVVAAHGQAMAQSPYRGRESLRERTYGVARAPSAAAPVLAPAVAGGAAPDDMTPLSPEDLRGAVADSALRTSEVDGKAHANVLKIGGRSSDLAGARTDSGSFTRLTPEPPPQAPEGLSSLGAGGESGAALTVVQAHGF